MRTERHLASPALRPFLVAPIEGWEQTNGSLAKLREVPFPGVPLILGLDSAWHIEGPESIGCEASFVAGLHAAPTLVRPDAASWSCIELRLTPVAAHRLLGLPMHELANRSVPLGEVLRGADELTERLREARSWTDRFVLVEGFLLRGLEQASSPAREVEWSWHELRRTAGRAPIRELADEVGWSHRRLIARFREQIGLAPKAVARLMRFDRAVQALRSPAGGLAEVAYDSGYFDQAHMNRDFRDLGGTTPRAFRSSLLESGGSAA
jgi:AraC-like DNA-binding protein